MRERYIRGRGGISLYNDHISVESSQMTNEYINNVPTGYLNPYHFAITSYSFFEKSICMKGGSNFRREETREKFTNGIRPRTIYLYALKGKLLNINNKILHVIAKISFHVKSISLHYL